MVTSSDISQARQQLVSQQSQITQQQSRASEIRGQLGSQSALRSQDRTQQVQRQEAFRQLGGQERVLAGQKEELKSYDVKLAQAEAEVGRYEAAVKAQEKARAEYEYGRDKFFSGAAPFGLSPMEQKGFAEASQGYSSQKAYAASKNMIFSPTTEEIVKSIKETGATGGLFTSVSSLDDTGKNVITEITGKNVIYGNMPTPNFNTPTIDTSGITETLGKYQQFASGIRFAPKMEYVKAFAKAPLQSADYALGTAIGSIGRTAGKVIPAFTVSTRMPTLFSTGLNVEPSFISKQREKVSPSLISKEVSGERIGETAAQIGSFFVPVLGITRFITMVGASGERLLTPFGRETLKEQVSGLEQTNVPFLGRVFTPTEAKVITYGKEYLTLAVGAYAGYKYLKSPVIKTEELILKKQGIPSRQQGIIIEKKGQTQYSYVDQLTGKPITIQTKGLKAFDTEVLAGRKTIVTSKARELLGDIGITTKPAYYAGSPYGKVGYEQYKSTLGLLQKGGLTESQARQTLRFVSPKYSELSFGGRALVSFTEDKTGIDIIGTQTKQTYKMSPTLQIKTMKPETSFIVTKGKQIATTDKLTGYEFVTATGKMKQGDLFIDLSKETALAKVRGEFKGVEFIRSSSMSEPAQISSEGIIFSKPRVKIEKSVTDLYGKNNIMLRVYSKERTLLSGKTKMGDVMILKGEPEFKISIDTGGEAVIKRSLGKGNLIRDLKSVYGETPKGLTLIETKPITSDIKTIAEQSLAAKTGTIIQTKTRTLPKLFQPQEQNLIAKTILGLKTISDTALKSNTQLKTDSILKTELGTDVRLKDMVTPRTIPDFSTALKEDVILRTIPSVDTTLRTIELPNLTEPTITQRTTPTIIEPTGKITVVPWLTPEKKKKRIMEDFITGFKTLIRRKGKFKALAGIRPKGEALKLGEKIAKSTLARTFKIEPAGRIRATRDFADYLPSAREFRSPKRPTGAIEFVQIKALTRGTREIPEIMSYKRAAARRAKVAWF